MVMGEVSDQSFPQQNKELTALEKAQIFSTMGSPTDLAFLIATNDLSDIDEHTIRTLLSFAFSVIANQLEQGGSELLKLPVVRDNPDLLEGIHPASREARFRSIVILFNPEEKSVREQLKDWYPLFFQPNDNPDEYAE